MLIKLLIIVCAVVYKVRMQKELLCWNRKEMGKGAENSKIDLTNAKIANIIWDTRDFAYLEEKEVFQGWRWRISLKRGLVKKFMVLGRECRRRMAGRF